MHGNEEEAPIAVTRILIASGRSEARSSAKPSVNGGLRQMTRFEIPTLTTDRLLLRAFRADDLDAFAAMRANLEVVRYLGTGRPSPQPMFGG
jgi:hypothetical protein